MSDHPQFLVLVASNLMGIITGLVCAFFMGWKGPWKK